MPKDDKATLQDINHSLGALETELLQRKLAQREGDLDDAVEVINDLAAQGHVDIGCDDDPPAE